jgi:hypothetical protein
MDLDPKRCSLELNMIYIPVLRLCEEVSHPCCHTDYGVDGQISEVSPNSWFCPKCMKYNPPSEEVLAAKLLKADEGKAELVVRGKECVSG